MVANGDMDESLSSLTYPSFISRDIFRLGFLMDGLNYLDIMACDVGS